ncbi:MAG: hypothetical protein JNL60_17510 [Bacteroidia bacterium]|nr:hypothetical protein [Bacteroidia bacterium]
MPPVSEKDKEILSLLQSGDDLALAKLCDDYYEAVYSAVCRFNSVICKEDETMVADVVTDCFLKFSTNPGKYNPEKSSLERFLIMDAEGDLKNAWEKRRRQNKNFVHSVELDQDLWNSALEHPTPLENMISKEESNLLEKKLRELFPKETDLAIAGLMLGGERRTEEYARLLQIEHLEIEDQRKEVKRNKDRIDKVMQRKMKGAR